MIRRAKKHLVSDFFHTALLHTGSRELKSLVSFVLHTAQGIYGVIMHYFKCFKNANGNPHTSVFCFLHTRLWMGLINKSWGNGLIIP